MSETIATPYFLIRTQKVDILIDDFLSSVKSNWKNAIVGYSFKTNNLPWIITHMKNKGLWAEVVSSDEYMLAKELGYESKNIIFNGPVKGKAEFIYAVENGSIVNIDSKRELLWLCECDRDKLRKSIIGLRVNFCIEEMCPGESQCGLEDGRFGFSYETGELKEAVEFLNENSIKLSGLHLHCSSKTRSLNIYKAIANMADKIVSEYSLDLNYIDVGGGYFGGVVGKPSFKEYFDTVYDIFKSNIRLSNTNIIAEPGMSLIGAGVDYIASVTDVKNTKNNSFVFLDGSRIHIDPFMRKSGYTYDIERCESSSEESKEQILCGFTCMEGDRFFTLNDKLLNVGDKLIFKKVGAYTMGLSPQFIEFYPAVYAENEDGLVTARRKNTARDFIK